MVPAFAGFRGLSSLSWTLDGVSRRGPHSPPFAGFLTSWGFLMSASITGARHRALRALAEGVPATLDLLADASGRSLGALQTQAKKEEWALPGRTGNDVAERVRVLALALLEKVEALVASDEGGQISRAEIDGLIAMIRGLEKIGEIMRPQEAVKENRQDEDLAASLECIDARIVELAHELAAQMVAGKCGILGGTPDEGRMAP